MHSGDASGVVPSSFRVLRSLLSRIEDENTGEVLIAEAVSEVPVQRSAQAAVAADVLGEMVWKKFPFHEGAQPVALRVCVLPEPGTARARVGEAQSDQRRTDEGCGVSQKRRRPTSPCYAIETGQVFVTPHNRRAGGAGPGGRETGQGRPDQFGRRRHPLSAPTAPIPMPTRLLST